MIWVNVNSFRDNKIDEIQKLFNNKTLLFLKSSVRWEVRFHWDLRSGKKKTIIFVGKSYFLVILLHFGGKISGMKSELSL